MSLQQSPFPNNQDEFSKLHETPFRCTQPCTSRLLQNANNTTYDVVPQDASRSSSTDNCKISVPWSTESQQWASTTLFGIVVIPVCNTQTVLIRTDWWNRVVITGAGEISMKSWSEQEVFAWRSPLSLIASIESCKLWGSCILFWSG